MLAAVGSGPVIWRSIPAPRPRTDSRFTPGVRSGFNIYGDEGAIANQGDLGEKIRLVADGVDQFRKYLGHWSEIAKSAAVTPKAQARQGRRGAPIEVQRSAANPNNDELDDALGDLNQSTNRLRRNFDATENGQGTPAQGGNVLLEDVRRINHAVSRSSYGSDAARLWAVLRNNITDLARAYGGA